jgi:hypothetical protein
MKRVVLSAFAVVALLALPVAAQDYGTTSTSEQTNTTPEVQEERTNPDMGTTAPGGGLTLTGTVVSWNEQELVVRTSTGIEHIVLQADTQRPSSFTVGEQVSVDYLRNSQNGVMIARVVRPGGEATTTAVGESQLEQEVEETVADIGEAADDVGAELSEVDDAVEEEVEEAVGTSIDQDEAIGNADQTAELDEVDDGDDSALPATGGKGPLAALLGLLALAGAAALRRV